MKPHNTGHFLEFAKKLIEAKESGAYDLAKNKRKSFCIIRHDSVPQACLGLTLDVSVARIFSWKQIMYMYGPWGPLDVCKILL
jgi:hypothetical protein